MLRTIISLLFLCTLHLSAQNYDNHTADLKGKKILVFSKNGEGYVHDNIAASVDMFIQLGQQEQFTVDTTTNSAVFALSSINQYDAVVFSNTNDHIFDTQAEKDGLIQYVRSGKGFMGIHSASTSEKDWEWYKQMTGGTFDFHPPFQTFTVKVVDELHPSAADIPTSWVVKDELYVMKELNPTIRIIMVADFSAADFESPDPIPNTFGKVFPCVWCNTFDGGRQWFSTLGHDKSDYSNPVFINHVLGGLKWIIRD